MSKSTQKPAAKSANNKSVENLPQKSRSNGKTTKQIMSRHIKDKNDVITEEEFKNLNIETDLHKDTAHEEIIIPDNPNHPKDEDKDPKIVTPWDVIA